MAIILVFHDSEYENREPIGTHKMLVAGGPELMFHEFPYWEKRVHKCEGCGIVNDQLLVRLFGGFVWINVSKHHLDN